MLRREIMWYIRSLLVLVIGLFYISPNFLMAAPASAADSTNMSILQFTGEEGISRPSAFEIDMSLPNKSASFESFVGKPLTVRLVPGQDVSGIVESIEQTGTSGEQGNYHVRLVSSLSRLNYRITSRTFYNQNVVDIVKAVLKDAGIANYDFRVSTSHQREVTIQYQESDFAFISRLLEGEGIHYHFEQSAQGDRVIFSEANSGFPMMPSSQLNFSPKETPAVSSFQRGQAMYSGKVQVGDYSWAQPRLDLSGAAQSTSFTDLAEQVFPAGIEKQDDAKAKAKLRLEAQVAGAQRCRGVSTYPQMKAGYRFTLAGNSRQNFNQEYVITTVQHRKTAEGYSNSFTCLPMNIAYRPKPATPLPTIAGVVPGIVVGPTGETKYVNKFGQVRVRFPWRNPANTPPDLGDAGWVRVMQLATGTGATAMLLPEVGDEVAVAFEHGDPNLPVVVGGLYNAETMPPLALPANKDRSLLRVQSKSGKTTEILFDNTNGSESLTLKSGDQTLTVSPKGIKANSGSESLTLQSGDQTLTVSPKGIKATSGSESLTLQSGNQTLTVSPKGIKANSGSESLTLQSGDQTLTVSPKGIKATSAITTPTVVIPPKPEQKTPSAVIKR
jgi:type VI secretion system secreted protein VgrG